jgi:hypothetical protein
MTNDLQNDETYEAASEQPAKERQSASSAELAEYFQARRQRLDVLATTTTPSGQTIDWIRRESQTPDGEIAEPPPVPQPILSDRERPEELGLFELEEPGVEHGPPGTVPIMQKRLDLLPAMDLQDYLSKYRYAVRDLVFTDSGFPIPFPELAGSHVYAATSQKTAAFGAAGSLSAFDPYGEAKGDSTLIQLGLRNRDAPKMQTVEAGWQQCHDIYGDWVPHLFLFYTTNGYTKSGDKLGGYNQDVDGWIQHDDSVHPGAIYRPTSVKGGAQFALHIKYQLFRNNWWFRCNNRWLGYYPAPLFMGKGSTFTTLGDHADGVHFFGEVFDADEVSGITKTDMGSGRFPADGWQFSAYMHNLNVQIDRGGKMGPYNGTPTVTDPNRYDVEPHMNSGGSWGSFLWVGGPGR